MKIGKPIKKHIVIKPVAVPNWPRPGIPIAIPAPIPIPMPERIIIR